MKLVAIVFLFSSGNAFAKGGDKTSAGGVAVLFGTGTMFGGNGALLEYQLPLSNSWRLTPRIGGGMSVGGTQNTTKDYYWLGYSLGTNLELGNRHRLIAGLEITTGSILNESSTSSPNTELHKNLVWGPSIIGGYKWTASFGLILQIYSGVTYIQNPFKTTKDYFLNPQVGMGLGYKF